VRAIVQAEESRATKWGGSGASFLYGTWRKGNWGVNIAQDQPRVREIDRVAAYRRGLRIDLPGAVKEITQSV